MKSVILYNAKLKSLQVFALFFIIIAYSGNSVFAQCPNDNVAFTETSYPPNPPCGSSHTILPGVGGGTYIELNVVSGANYTFSTCGSSINTQLTGYEGTSPAPSFYNNNSSTCSPQSTVIWTSTFSGTLRLNVDQFNCTFSTTSAILAYQQNDNLTFTPPSDVCVGDAAFDLDTYANSAAGSFSGTGVIGSTFDPSAAGVGTHIITFNLGQCSAQSSISVSPSPNVNITAQDVSCNGADDGEATANASGGGGSPYDYAWDDPNNQTTQTATGLAPGTYTVTVTDDVGCEATESVTISEPPLLDIALVSNSDASCGGVNNGVIEVSASGGTPPYQFSANGSPYQPSETFNGLSAGTYTIEVLDAAGCTDTIVDSIANAYNITLTLDSVQNVSCPGANDGRIEVTASGGTSPYQYSLDNVVFQSSNVFENLPNGVGSVLARDAVGCIDIVSYTIVQPDPIAVDLDSVKNIGCKGDSTGSVYVSVSGGNPPYTYSWSYGSVVTEDLENVPAGTYRLTVTDNLNCTQTFRTSVNEPLALYMNLASSQDASCYGYDNAEIDITVNGGVPPYTYQWSDTSFLEDLTNIAAGTYSVTATDFNGCTIDSTFSVSESDSISTAITGTAANCGGGIGGSVDLTVSGGTPGYNFFWSNGTTNEDLNNISGGAYTVLVLDANGCSARDSFFVDEPATLEIVDVFKKSSGCGNSADGIIEVEVEGGTRPYTYAWPNRPPSQADSSIIGVSAGIYTVTVTDDNGCEVMETIELSSLPEPVTAFFFENACDGEEVDFHNNSTISSGSLTYEWDFGDNETSSFPNPSHIYTDPGNYTVELTAISDEGCEVTVSENIEVFALPDAEVLIDGDTLSPCSEEEATLETPENPNYVYLWSNGENTSSIVVDEGGEYTVQVTDTSNGCVNVALGLVRIASPGLVSVTPDTTISLGFSVQLQATGGVVYTWTPEDFLDNNLVSNPVATPPQNQTYIVEIEDDLGCTYLDSVNITVVQDFALDVPNVITPNGDGFNDVWRIENVITYPDNQVSIFNRWGNEVFTAKNYNNDWDGENLADGTYYYVIRFEESDRVHKGAVTILR